MIKISKNDIPVDKLSLNEKQREAAYSDDRPLLIVAGAGTGKTRTLTTRIAYLMEKGVPPDKICALTFTNKAAKEMLDRVTKHATYSTKQLAKNPPFIGTFHSLGARILRREGHLLGRKPNFVIFDDDDSLRLVKKIVKELTQSGFHRHGQNESSLKKELKPAVFYNLISQIKNGMVSIESLKSSSALKDKIAIQIFETYEQKLLANNAFDFDDLIGQTVKVLKAHPLILSKYHKKFSHILVDEYQDINNIQYELIKLLAGKEGNLSVVGDHEQTIYGWRGSDIKIFLSFSRDWPEAKVVMLEENYRSTSNIISAASGVIKNNNYYAIDWGTRNFWTKNEAGELVEILENTDEYDEAEKIIERLHELGEQEYPGTAILYRTNAQSRAIEQALLENEIPYRIYGGVKFYERLEVRDVVAALRIALNFQDELSRERLEKNLGKRRFLSYLEATPGILKKPLEVIEAFMRSADYIDYLERNFTNSSERQENIGELLVFASQFDDLSELLEKISLLQATDSVTNDRQPITNDRSKVVSLMTIHLAKGLEFDNVIIAGLSEGILPHHRSLDSQPEVEEERRLMYVAMTRARKKLFLSFYDLPSRFLGEVPVEFTNFSGERSLDDEERYITLD
ncbi:MAG: UvrD-helicase domain-containing protein [bacterium]|nr:UvrD-helicase domain-containing protein [bacterium]